MWPVERGRRESDFRVAPSTRFTCSGSGRNDNRLDFILGFSAWVLSGLSAVAWRVGMAAGLGEGAGSSSGGIRIMLSRSRATTLLGSAVSEISVRGARVPSLGSVVISSTVSGMVVASRGVLGRLRLAIWRPYRSRPARRGSISLEAMRWRTSPMEAWMADRSSGNGRWNVERRLLRCFGLAIGLRVVWW